MQIVCKDGTTIQCHDFEAIDAGVLFFRAPPARPSERERERDEAGEEPRADGFVPITELHLVVPDEMVQQGPTGRTTRQEQGHPSQQPTAASQPGEMAQQQQIQQFPGYPGQ